MSQDDGKFLAKFDYPADFSGVSIGENTARIGLQFSRERMGLDKADELFCNRRLIGRLVLGHVDDANMQGELFDGAIAIYGAFDVKGYRVNAAHFAIGATFSRQDVDLKQLADFAKNEGRLQVSELSEIPDDKKTPEHEPGSLAVEDGQPWRDYPMATIFKDQPSILKALKAAKIETVGDLSDYQAKGQWLTNIKGLGEKKAALLEETMMHFWADNPEGQDEHEQAVGDVFRDDATEDAPAEEPAAAAAE